MRALALLLSLALAGCGGRSASGESDWERQQAKKGEFVEELPVLPAPPRPETLIEFAGAAGTDFRFFIDGATLSPGKDGVVRYVLVARSPGGVENVSFEGLRCQTGEIRRYAVGRADGSWSSSSGGWIPMQTAWQRALGNDYFCPQTNPIRDRAEGVSALRNGGHPFRRGFDADSLRLPR